MKTSSDAPTPHRVSRSKFGRHWLRVMTWARRAHLYCGLAMLPWVILYAVSGFLFNHPSLASDQPVTRFTIDDLPSPARTVLPTAAVAAPRLIEAMRTAAPDAAIVLTDEPPPAYSGSLRARGSLGDRDVRLSFDVEDGDGSVRMVPRPIHEEPVALRDVDRLAVQGLEMSTLESVVYAIAEDHGAAGAELEVSSAPRLEFGADIDGVPWLITYDPEAGSIDYERADQRPPIRLARLLARLHMVHTYPNTIGARWVHAFIVDLTVVCLLLWCLTGLAMAWQLRRLRRVSMVVSTSGFVASVALLARVIPALL